MHIRFANQDTRAGIGALMPIGTRQYRQPTVAEVVHFETCWAGGPYSAVNVDVPHPVPVWQYIDADARRAAARSQA